MQKQRQLVAEAKLRIRGIRKEIADLKREMYFLEQLIRNEEYIESIKKSNLTEKWKAKRKNGQRNKKDMLKAVIDGVRGT